MVLDLKRIIFILLPSHSLLPTNLSSLVLLLNHILKQQPMCVLRHTNTEAEPWGKLFCCSTLYGFMIWMCCCVCCCPQAVAEALQVWDAAWPKVIVKQVKLQKEKADHSCSSVLLTAIVCAGSVPQHCSCPKPCLHREASGPPGEVDFNSKSDVNPFTGQKSQCTENSINIPQKTGVFWMLGE